MNAREKFSHALSLTFVIAVVIAVAAVWYSRPVSAIKEVDGRSEFGIVSLGAGQTARLNVVDTRAIDPEDATAGDGSVRKVTLAFDLYVPATATDEGGGGRTTASCLVKQRFLRRESCEVTLGPGEAASFDFTAPEGTRVRAVSYGTPDTRGGRGRAADPKFNITLEVQEGGRSIFVLSPAEAVYLKEVDG